MTYADQLKAVRELLGPDGIVFHERNGKDDPDRWVIAIVKNAFTGPPYDVEEFGSGETFEGAWVQARRAAGKVRKP